MGAQHFVGRADALRQVHDVLTGVGTAGGNLTVQSIEGPGGIGKTFLFDHALAGIDLTARNYLTLRINSNEPSELTLLRAIERMVNNAEADAIRHRPSRYYFPSVDRVVTAIETIRSAARAEFEEQHPDNDTAMKAFLRFLDLAFEAGKRVNDAFPITEKYVNARKLAPAQRLIEATVPLMGSLRKEARRWFETVGWFSQSRALRNSVKENACRPLANGLVSDLSAILTRYRTQDRLKATHGKVRGIDRLLLVLDDYERLQYSLGEFLVCHLLPTLRSVNFQSVVFVLGRDQLAATHPAWDHHLKANMLQCIELSPFSKHEMDQLVESYGVTSPSEKQRAWNDTQGYPYYVQLWIEEMESGGRTALMLKRFHDRTTRWMGERERGWLQHMLFLDAVNKRTLRAMLDDGREAEEAFAWFERAGSVRDTSGSFFRVRGYLRSRLIDYLRASDPERCEQLQRKGEAAMNIHG